MKINSKKKKVEHSGKSEPYTSRRNILFLIKERRDNFSHITRAIDSDICYPFIYSAFAQPRLDFFYI